MKSTSNRIYVKTHQNRIRVTESMLKYTTLHPSSQCSDAVSVMQHSPSKHTHVCTHRHTKYTQEHTLRHRKRHTQTATQAQTHCLSSPLPHEWDVNTVSSCNSHKGYPSANQGRGFLHGTTTNTTQQSPATAVSGTANSACAQPQFVRSTIKCQMSTILTFFMDECSTMKIVPHENFTVHMYLYVHVVDNMLHCLRATVCTVSMTLFQYSGQSSADERFPDPQELLAQSLPSSTTFSADTESSYPDVLIHMIPCATNLTLNLCLTYLHTSI